MSLSVSGHEVSDNIETVAQAFVSARHDARSLADYPGALPADLDEAYLIQSRAIAIDGRPIIGWKVGRIPEPLSETHGTDRLVGPIFADTLCPIATGTLVETPIFADGFAAVEAELMLHVVRLPAGDPMTLDDAATLALVDDVRVGFEIASSPFPGINALGPLVTASDFGNNAGLLLGPVLPDWQSRDLRKVHVSLDIDGVAQGASDMTGLPGGPLGSVRRLLANLQARDLLGTLPFWVSAGAITGVHQIEVGSTAEAVFDRDIVLRCRTTEATARR